MHNCICGSELPLANINGTRNRNHRRRYGLQLYRGEWDTSYLCANTLGRGLNNLGVVCMRDEKFLFRETVLHSQKNMRKLICVIKKNGSYILLIHIQFEHIFKYFLRFPVKF